MQLFAAGGTFYGGHPRSLNEAGAAVAPEILRQILLPFSVAVLQ